MARKIHPVVLFALGVGILILIYLPALPSDMILIDDIQLTAAPQMVAPISATTLREIFTVGSHFDYYPVRDLSYLIDRHLFANEMVAYRLHEIALFFVLTVVVWLLLIEFGLPKSSAGLITSLWAFHPAHAELLMWISARKDLLALLFAALATLVFARANRTRSPLLFVTALMCFSFSLLSKASFSLLPLAALLSAFLFFPSWRNRFALPTLFAALGLGLISSLFQSWFYTSVNDMRMFYPWSYRLEASAAAFFKMAAGWIDVGQNILDVENWGQWVDLNHAYVIPGIVLWFAIPIAFTIYRKNRIAAATILFFALLYLPISGLAFPHRSFYSIRYLEPALLALFLGLGVIWARSKYVTYFAIACIPLYLLGHILESKHWDTPIAVAEKALDHYPDSLILRTRVLAEVRNFMHQRPPTPEMVQKEEELTADIKSRCAAVEARDGRSPNCWLFYLLQLSQFPKDSHYEELFVKASNFEQPPPHSLLKVQFEQNLRRGSFDDALIERFLAENPYKPIPSYRELEWIAACKKDGPEKSRQLLLGYVNRHLIDPVTVISDVQFYPAPVVETLATCFPDLPNMHLRPK